MWWDLSGELNELVIEKWDACFQRVGHGSSICQRKNERGESDLKIVVLELIERMPTIEPLWHTWLPSGNFSIEKTSANVGRQKTLDCVAEHSMNVNLIPVGVDLRWLLNQSTSSSIPLKHQRGESSCFAQRKRKIAQGA
jgi:hypothetical protein